MSFEVIRDFTVRASNGEIEVVTDVERKWLRITIEGSPPATQEFSMPMNKVVPLINMLEKVRELILEAAAAGRSGTTDFEVKNVEVSMLNTEVPTSWLDCHGLSEHLRTVYGIHVYPVVVNKILHARLEQKPAGTIDGIQYWHVDCVAQRLADFALEHLPSCRIQGKTE